METLSNVLRAISPRKRASKGGQSPIKGIFGGRDRKYDLVILGATGFTGRLCAEYVAQTYADSLVDFSWAIAGRSREKLEGVLETLECASKPSIIICDCGDFNSVHEMCRDAFVVLNTVGPFEKYATPVVKSCATLGTNYCDITGEVHWAALMEKKYGAAAAENRALIIPMCGFDSIPADITTFMVALHMAEKLGKECGQTKAFWHDMRGSISGGTIHTMIGILTRPFSEYRDVLRSASDSYSYNPPSSWRGTDSELTESRMPWFDLDTLKITAPFIMSFPNTRVVRRSAAVLNYGKRFRYRETYMAEWTAYDIATGIALTFAPVLLLVMALVPPLRWFMTAFILPAPGDGPSKEERESGRFKLTVIGRTDGSDEQGNGVPVTATFSAKGDPGYKVTSRMAVESAMAIALHKDELPGRKGGFHTPSSGIGRTLISRLRASGIKMEVHDAEDNKAIQDKAD